MAFEITYEIDAKSSDVLIDAIRVEQTIEFPYKLAKTWIQNEVVGQVVSKKEKDNKSVVTISYADEVVGNELPQFLNLLWGNVSLFNGVKVTDINFPESFLNSFSGPRFGIKGLRNLLKIEQRPILMTALKPMGESSLDLAKMAKTLVEGGIDVIKDDHNLANQPWAKWQERVETIANAINKANEEFGTNAIYAPSLNRPTDQLIMAAKFAKQIGCKGLLVLPGICGFDAMRVIAEDNEIALPILSHPALLGSHVMNPNHGLSHAITFATLVRIAGGDFTIFPNQGGRFSFSLNECKSIVEASLSKLGNIKPISAALAGGMTVERTAEIMNNFGKDITILIGGALHDGDLLANTRRLRQAVESV
ncbi:MAG: RuBisCO large subunit C-terminal-like domain-containing protein [Candidatus Nanopelagicales bacterium]